MVIQFSQRHFLKNDLLIFGRAGSLLLCAGFSLVAVRGLLVAVASLVSEHGLWVHGLQQL